MSGAFRLLMLATMTLAAVGRVTSPIDAYHLGFVLGPRVNAGGRVGAAEPIGGSGFELQAIGAAVIGGASLFGGEGNPLGSLIGALTLGAMQNGLTLMNVPSFWQFVATGAVVILAVFVDQATRKRQ